jgi:hypothetical protein
MSRVALESAILIIVMVIVLVVIAYLFGAFLR